MPQQQVEIILMRQLADCLATPIGIVGLDGEVLYYNQPAAGIAARRFEEAGTMTLDTLPSMFQMTDADGSPLQPADTVTSIALKERRPGHRPLRMRGLDGVWREIELTAFPLEGQGGRLLGAVVIFWETGDPSVLARAEAWSEPTSEQQVEIILMRQLADCLAMPIWIVGLDENVIFYNEPAEEILARRFEEAGPMPLEELATIFQTVAIDGSPLRSDELPIAIALKQRRPAHLPLRICGLDGVWRDIEVTAFPLEGQGGRHLAAVAIFWEAAGA